MSRTYLLIDDNVEFLENLAEILRDTGAVVEVASDGFLALRLAQARRFDAVVTDMRMPGMSGAELVGQLREVDPGVPVVLLSAYSMDSQLRDARRRGLLAVLSKPHQMTRLLELLAAARRDATVLLVEDDVALADNLSEALAARGVTVCAVSSLTEVAQVAIKPFAALVDLRLPGGPSGASVTRVRERFPGTPTLVITAYADEAVAGDELFVKPFDTVKLVERVAALYERAHP